MVERFLRTRPARQFSELVYSCCWDIDPLAGEHCQIRAMRQRVRRMRHGQSEINAPPLDASLVFAN